MDLYARGRVTLLTASPDLTDPSIARIRLGKISPRRLSWSSVRQLLSRLTKSISWSTHMFQPSWKPISSCRRRPASSLWSTTTE